MKKGKLQKKSSLGMDEKGANMVSKQIMESYNSGYVDEDELQENIIYSDDDK